PISGGVCTRPSSPGPSASPRRRRSGNPSSCSIPPPGARRRIGNWRKRCAVARKGGLGKGLGALIPPGAAEGLGAGGYQELPVSTIRPNRYQPREHFGEEQLSALADSIREVGLLQPVLVRPADDGYELIAGERRWRAARRAGLQTIPALVRETDDNSTLEQALVENLQREGLNPLQEAGAYQQRSEH